MREKILKDVLIMRDKIMKFIIGEDFVGNDLIFNISEELKNKYADALNYYLYHVLVGSSVDRDKKCDQFDFPREDSIYLILQREYQRIFSKEFNA